MESANPEDTPELRALLSSFLTVLGRPHLQLPALTLGRCSGAKWLDGYFNSGLVINVAKNLESAVSSLANGPHR